MQRFAVYPSPLGELVLIAGEQGLEGVHFREQKYFPQIDESWPEDGDAPVIRETMDLLRRYFAGERVHFDVPLAPRGTAGQLAVWKAISTVPYGETISYGELARRAGIPNAPRAAGAATGRNPIGIIVPCHRIVGANGKLTGYAGGLDRKRALLALEAGFEQPALAGTL